MCNCFVNRKRFGKQCLVDLPHFRPVCFLTERFETAVYFRDRERRNVNVMARIIKKSVNLFHTRFCKQMGQPC